MAHRQEIKRTENYTNARLGRAHSAGLPTSSSAAALAQTIALARAMAGTGNAITDMPRAQAAETGAAAEYAQALGATVRVAIYSDEPILATGLRDVVTGDPKLRLAGCCTSVEQLMEQLATGTVDVAVVDFTEEITAGTLATLLHLAGNCKLILWTNGIEGELALRALKVGIRGVLRKSLPLETHRECLHRVNAGEVWFERQLPESVN
jgi:hypothetical protein